MGTSRNVTVDWKNVPTQTVSSNPRQLFSGCMDCCESHPWAALRCCLVGPSVVRRCRRGCRDCRRSCRLCAGDTGVAHRSRAGFTLGISVPSCCGQQPVANSVPNSQPHKITRVFNGSRVGWCHYRTRARLRRSWPALLHPRPSQLPNAQRNPSDN
jgi:hypothetical protein